LLREERPRNDIDFAVGEGTHILTNPRVYEMKALVFCDDYWHPAHVPREGLGTLTRTEFTFDWIENTRDWLPESMMTYPLAILSKSNNISAADPTGWMTDTIQAVFSAYVHKGNGLLAIHSGTAGYDQIPRLRSLLGGVFRHHPEQCPVTIIPHLDHPLSAGSGSFTVKDEQYVMEMDDPQVDVFMTTSSEHGRQPGGWRRTEGQGRVAVLTPGHNLEVWLHPSFQALLLNAARWCSKLI
jgi:type 1 glutamine amidotransferase